MLGKDTPDFNNEILTAGELVLHEIDIEIEVFVIELVGDLLSNQSAQLLQIHDKSGLRIRSAFYGHNKVEIVPMPVLIGARAEYFRVPFLAPGRIMKLMGSVEMFLAGYVDHIDIKYSSLPASVL